MPRSRFGRDPLLSVAMLLALSLPGLGCRSSGGHDARTFRKEGVDFSKYGVVVVEEAEVSTTAERNAQVDATLRELKSIAETSLVSALEATRRFERVTLRREEAVPGRTLLCRSTLTVHFGSTALRVIVGFGAGRSGLQMTPALHDAETGELLLSYQGWGGAISGWGAQIVEKMRVDCMRIANYFAGLVGP